MDFVVDLGATALVTKVFVDVIQMAFPKRPDWVPPVVALVSGVVFAALVAMSAGHDLMQMWPQVVLAGVLACGSAVGVTELQAAAKRRQAA